MAELSCHASMMTTSKTTSPRQDLTKGFWRENPVLIHLLGLCPTLAVTNSVANSIVMGIATFFVLVGSSLLVSTVKRFVPNEVRIATYILIIATFVTIAEFALQALVPDIHKALGPFVALIVVNLFGPRYEPWVIMVLPPGGFFTLAFVLLAIAWWKQRKAVQAKAAEPRGLAAAERAA